MILALFHGDNLTLRCVKSEHLGVEHIRILVGPQKIWIALHFLGFKQDVHVGAESNYCLVLFVLSPIYQQVCDWGKGQE